MQLTIVSHNKQIFEGVISSLIVPGSAGCFQILTDHASLVSNLTSGKVVYRNELQESELVIEQGIVAVHNNKITLLIEVAKV